MGVVGDLAGLIRRLESVLVPGTDRLEPAIPACDEEPVPADVSWQEQLERRCQGRSIRVRPALLSAREAIATAAPHVPLVSCRPDADSGWGLLLEQRRGKGRVAFGHGEERWLDPEELAEHLGARDPDIAFPWILAQPRFPAYGPPGDAHADHGPNPFRRLVGLLRPDRGDLLAVVLFGVVIGGLTLATPVAVQQLVNTVAFGGLVQPVVILALLLFAVLAFSAVLSGVQAYVAEHIQRRVFVRVVLDLAERLPRVRGDAFDQQHGPELVNRLFDIVTVQKIGAMLLLEGTAVILQTLVGLLVLSFYHPYMLGFSVLLVGAIAFVTLVMGRGAVTTAVGESRAKYAVVGWMEELARHPEAFRSARARRYAAMRADQLAGGYVHARRRHYRIVLRQLTGALGLQVVASSGLLALGGGLVVAGQLTLGQLVASELILTAIVAAFAKLGKQLESFYDVLAATEKLGMLFDIPLERDGGCALVEGEGPASLELRDVGFGHGRRSLLSGLSLRIEAGECLGLLGPTGSGKSTLIDLMSGVRIPDSGFVLLDGQDLRDVRPEEVRSQVFVLREPEVFCGTVLDNVRVGRTDLGVDEVVEALAQVGLLDEIRALPEGLNAQLATNGDPLSQGQVARLMLARALVSRPRLLLLDRALSAIDERDRKRALDAIFRPEAPWTVVAVSPWPDVLRRCTRFVDLTGTAGKVEEATRETEAGER